MIPPFTNHPRKCHPIAESPSFGALERYSGRGETSHRKKKYGGSSNDASTHLLFAESPPSPPHVQKRESLTSIITAMAFSVVTMLGREGCPAATGKFTTFFAKGQGFANANRPGWAVTSIGGGNSRELLFPNTKRILQLHQRLSGWFCQNNCRCIGNF